MNILHRSIQIVPVLLLMGTIFFLSHQPGTDLQLPSIPGLDKLAHGVIYAALAATALYAAPREILYSKPFLTSMLVVLFCLLYGITDEYHQSFIPEREASLGDLAADTAGATVLVFLWLRYQKPGKPHALSD